MAGGGKPRPLACGMVHRLFAAALAVAVGCGTALAQPVAAPDCTAEVEVSATGLQLDVFYRCRSAMALTFRPDGERVAAKVLDFHGGAGEQSTPQAAPSSGGWRVEPRNGLVEARYRFDLGGYARAIDTASMAVLRGEGVLSSLSGWLLEPRGLRNPPVIDIRAKMPPGLQFQSGLPRVGDAWRLSGIPVRFAGFTAIGRFSVQDIAVPAPGSLLPGAAHAEGVIHLVLLDGLTKTGRANIGEWVRRTAMAEANYWGGFTAKEMMLAMVPIANRGGIGYGRTESGGGVTVMMELGTNVDPRRLYNEWVLVHELIHTGMPYLMGRASWFMEGAATYVEPIIRARAGWKAEEDVWQEWIERMPQGVSVFAAGLSTATGRQNYWGGAIFMLLADLELRRATSGAKGLEDCLKGALVSGLGGPERIDLDDYAKACDHATGTHVVSALIEKHFNRQAPVDLAALWKDLGVSQEGGRIVLNDAAPLAQWRKMIVMGPPGRPRNFVPRPWES
jgi:hypothetical protein